MIELKDIEKELVKSDTEKLPDNFVAIAVQLNDKGVAIHSGLIIGVKGEHKLFHFTISDDIKLEDIPSEEWYFHKEIKLISPSEVNVFLQRCKMIQDTANPRFGFFYDGSYYNEKGKLVSTANKGGYTNCSLFCINVILGYIESETYFEYSDWTSDKVSDGFYQSLVNRRPFFISEMELENLKSILIRIPPIDYTASAFKNELPIRKQDIGEEVELLTEHFASYEMLINSAASK